MQGRKNNSTRKIHRQGRPNLKIPNPLQFIVFGEPNDITNKNFHTKVHVKLVFKILLLFTMLYKIIFRLWV